MRILTSYDDAWTLMVNQLCFRSTYSFVGCWFLHHMFWLLVHCFLHLVIIHERSLLAQTPRAHHERLFVSGEQFAALTSTGNITPEAQKIDGTDYKAWKTIGGKINVDAHKNVAYGKPNPNPWSEHPNCPKISISNRGKTWSNAESARWYLTPRSRATTAPGLCSMLLV